jgi:hypothetical protein
MRSFFPALFFLLSSILFAQSTPNNIGNTVIDSYKSYFELPRETLFTHLNKTTFIVGENMWFKTYARDRHFDAVSKSTTNINVGIYNDRGKLIKKDLWFAVNGSAHGNVLIDSTFTTGDYYVKASTNWMRNFKESDAFVQKITIIGDSIVQTHDSIANTLDLQFLPEAGHIVSDVPNVIGLKILNKNGKGVKLEGIIYDESDNEITTFKSNNFGIGKFLLVPEHGKAYTAKIELRSGRTITKTIDNINNQGIALQVNNLNPEKLILTLNTNTATHNVIKDKTYTIVLHKNGNLKTIPFSFGDTTSKTLVLPRADLYSDVNIITVFDDLDRPLLERLFFNDRFKISQSTYSISEVKRANDSIVYSIQSSIINKLNDSISVSTNLSVSVLNETNLGYNPDHNILSANYLKPYLRGYIESPSYYFTDLSRKKSYELDMLLITQGWSRYDWAYIFNNKPKTAFSFDNGVTLNGKLIAPKEIKVLKMQSPELMGNDWLNIEVNKNNLFTIKNLYPYKNETIRISYLDRKNKYRKPNLSLGFTISDFEDRISEGDLMKGTTKLIELKVSKRAVEKGFFYEKAFELEEVLLTGKTKKEEKKQEDIIAPDFTFKNNYLAINLEEIRRFPRILDVIAYNGYEVGRDLGQVVIRNRNPSSPNSSGAPLIYLDGARLNDFNVLFNFLSNNVEGISIDRSGLGYGMNGTEGVIRIFTRSTSLYDTAKKSDDYAFRVEASNGFTRAKEFYTPRYKSYTSNLFMYYGVIGWFPVVQLQNSKPQLFTLPNTKSNIIKFYIEGYDSENNLVSQIISLDDAKKKNK